MSDGGGPFSTPPGANEFGELEGDETPWFKRPSTWLWPALVILGALVAVFGPK